MCTVSIVPTVEGCRVVCNRDERRTRPAARPPRPQTTVSGATYPEDPVSGGTWIGVNDNGLILALLNKTSTPGVVRQPARSRGVIVPELLACASMEQAVKRMDLLDSRIFEPFRLVVVQHSMVAVITSDSSPAATETIRLASPVMFTSSSLGDAVVDGPRRKLFEQIVVRTDDWLRGQRHFHRHQWPERPEVSVRMAREDAATVSRTTIDVTARGVELEYEHLIGDGVTVPAAA
jgi:hypothetical protein